MADSGAPGANGSAGGMPPTRGHTTAPGPGGHLAHGRPVHPAIAPPPHSSIPKPTSNTLIATGVVCGPRIVILHRYNGDFGFTLRHFIVYPPDSLTEPTINPLTTAGVLNFAQPMDTVFVKKVHANTPAHMAGLQEGDRLLAVNGVPVTSIPYSQVVATIQQTPKTLTLQVVPKNYDILQTFFSETAHNPETNQRPQPQQPYAPKPIGSASGAYPKSKPAPSHPLTVEGVQEKQESLYSTLQEIVADNVGAPQPGTKSLPLYAEVQKKLTHPVVSMVPHMTQHLPKSVAPKPVPMPYDQQQHYMHLHQQQQQQFLQKISSQGHGKDGGESLPPVTGDGGYAPLGESDSAIMSRLRKSLEQKEEFLRRPPATMQGALVPMGAAQPPTNGLPSAHDVQQREFYARPNRLQKSVWPPSQSQLSTAFGVPTEPNKASGGFASPPSGTLAGTVPTTNGSPTTPSPSQLVVVATTSSNVAKPMVSSTNMLREHASQLSAIREHFFTSGIGGSLQLPPKSAPPSLAIAPVAITTTAGPSSPTGAATVPLSPHSMHAVSEKAKLFESGRPLSPEGIDRMDLYKSELSRINTKQVVPNVAVRRKEFELKAESTGWRKSIEDKPRSVSSDSESRRTPVRLRSLSVESNATRDSRHSLASSSLLPTDSFDAADKEKENQQQYREHPGVPPVAMLRQKPIRDDSYRNAVRNSTAFWLQGPLPSSHGTSTLAESSSINSVLSLVSESDTSGSGRPIPPARTYAAAHRLHHPLSAADTEQMRMKLLHRNQTIVDLRHFLAGDGDSGADGAVGGDIEMLHRPPLTSPPLAPLSPLTVASSVTSTSSVPLTHLVALEHPTITGSAGTGASGTAAPPSTPTASSSTFRFGTGPIRPTTLNLCTDGSVPAVVMRQKVPLHPLLLEDDERKMRRISYLRATAHDNLFQMLESDADSSPMSLPPTDTPDTDATEPPAIESPSLPKTAVTEDSAASSGKMQPQQLKSAYRPWRRPRLTNDIRPLRRLFDPVSSDSTTSSPLPPILETDYPPGTSAPSAEPSTKKRARPRPIPRPLDPQDVHDVDADADVDDDDFDEVDEDREDPATGRPRSPTPRSMVGKGRSASLVTTTPLGGGTGGRLFGAAGSLGNLHVITTTTAGGVVTRNYFFAQSHGTKSKALAHFRDGAADTTEPLVREGELHVKVTLIDGKRSADRSWRTVHAELRGHHLKLTLVREGKNSNQSPEPCGTIDLTNFHVTEGNYTKRKNVFKLTTAVGSYCPLEAAAVAGFGHVEVHRTQSASGLANVGGAGSTCGSSIRSASTVGLPGSERELLLQADSHSDMQQWMESLRLVCGGGSTSQLHSPDYLSGRGGQQAEPQRIAAQTSVQVHAGSVSGGGNSGDDYSPVLPAKSHRKYALGSRSPSGQSPVTKSRKTPQTGCSSPTGSADQPIVPIAQSSNQPATGQYHQPHHQPHHLTLQQQQQQQQQQFASTKDSSDRESGSPKSKTWKGIVARQFRKMQGQPPGSPGASGSGGSDLMALPDGASINVPLQQCPVSEENPYVPLVLAKCTGIVESKGLGVVGIYRIPGNTAAITQLTETINRGLDEAALRDPRWEDVNVVSSLLKSFIRNLPEPLLPNELYGGFIAADKMTGQRRLLELRQLLRRVPPMNYETLKHLMRHLHRVSTHNEVNLMDARNLAIVFGPSVVRSANESLETAVKDMRHQCQIVEVLINYYQYFFEDGLLPSVDESKTGTGTVVDSGLEVPSTSLLLDNVAKIEPFKEQSKESTSGFVANIVQAANRKIRRTAQRKSTMSSTTPDTLSLDSTTSAESKEQSSRVIRRYLELGPKGGTAMSVGAGSGGSERTLQVVHDPTGPAPIRGPRSVGSAGPGCEPPTDDSLLQMHHHHHHHHHYYHSSSSRHHSSQSNDDASSVLNRSSEDDSNDSAFADNGSMSLKTVTIALDNKLRSLRDSSIDSDRDQTQESDGDLSGGYGNGRHSLHQQWSHMGRSPRPLTLGENIPYADESPERPLIQGRSKPQRSLTIASVNNNNNQEDSVSGTVVTPGKQQQLKKALTAHSQKSIDSGGTVNSSTNNSCLTLVNETDATLDGVGGHVDGDGEEREGGDDGQQQPVSAKGRNVSLSSDETDTSTTSNPREKLTAATYRIDTEKLKKMNRILTQLERKANNLERKFNLNRSLSLNYKSPKAVDCCCSHHGGLPGTHSSQTPLAHCCQHQQQQQQQQQQQHITNNLNNNNSTSCHNHNGATVGGTIVSLRSRFSLTKDEKTDKNINRRRQIHDTTATTTTQPGSGTSAPATSGGCATAGNGNASGSNDSSSCGEPCGPQIILTPAASTRQRRHVGSRSIRRRHTVGGTHDYYSNKMNGQHHHHHHHPHHHPHQHHHVGPGCCPVPQN